MRYLAYSLLAIGFAVFLADLQHGFYALACQQAVFMLVTGMGLVAMRLEKR